MLLLQEMQAAAPRYRLRRLTEAKGLVALSCHAQAAGSGQGAARASAAPQDEERDEDGKWMKESIAFAFSRGLHD